MSYSIALTRFTRIAGAATALLLVPASATHAQSAPNPNHPQAEADYLWWQLPPGEEQYARIDGYRIKEDLQEIVAIARRSREDGNQYWGVIAGQPYHDQVREWIGSQFERVGLQNVRHQIYDLDPQWVPQSWEVSVTAGGRTVVLESANVPYEGEGTPPGGLDLEPVWLGLGTESDFIGRDVRGKAAIVLAEPRPTARGHSGHPAARRAVERGAAAVIWVFSMLGNPQVQPMGQVYEVPAFMLGLHDGEFIEGMIGRGENPRLHLRADIREVPNLRSGDVFGVLPGTTDENIFIVAHFDAFFQGALDNASGVAGMVALAEYFAQVPQSQRRRNIIFAGLCCHHEVPGLNGTPNSSRWIIENMRPELDKTAIVINMEHLSQTQTYWASPGQGSRGYAGPDGLVYSNTVSARRWYASGSDALRGMVTKTWRDFGVATYAAQESNPGGELGPFPAVAPSIHIIDHTFYHTSMDTPDLVPATGLQSAVQAFAKIIDEVNRMDMREVRGDAYPVVAR
jgi:hypothetical protein